MNASLRHTPQEVQTRNDNAGQLSAVILSEFLDLHVAVKNPCVKQCSTFVSAMRDISDQPSEWELTRVAEHARALPPIEELSALNRKLSRSPDRLSGRHSRMIITAMLNAIASFNAEKSIGYIDNLLFAVRLAHEEEELTVEALAGAAFCLSCSETFAPPAEKLIKFARSEANTILAAANVVSRAVEERHRFDKLRAALRSHETAHADGAP